MAQEFKNGAEHNLDKKEISLKYHPHLLECAIKIKLTPLEKKKHKTPWKTELNHLSVFR